MDIPSRALALFDMSIFVKDIYFDVLSSTSDYSSVKWKFKLCYSVIEDLPWIPAVLFFFVLNWLTEEQYIKFNTNNSTFIFNVNDVNDIQYDNHKIKENFNKAYSYINFDSRWVNFCETKENIKKARDLGMFVYTWSLKDNKFLELKTHLERWTINCECFTKKLSNSIRKFWIEDFEDIEKLAENDSFLFIKKYMKK